MTNKSYNLIKIVLAILLLIISVYALEEFVLNPGDNTYKDVYELNTHVFIPKFNVSAQDVSISSCFYNYEQWRYSLPFNLTVEAVDSPNFTIANLIEDYNGTINVTHNGSGEIWPWPDASFTGEFINGTAKIPLIYYKHNFSVIGSEDIEINVSDTTDNNFSGKDSNVVFSACCNPAGLISDEDLIVYFEGIKNCIDDSSVSSLNGKYFYLWWFGEDGTWSSSQYWWAKVKVDPHTPDRLRAKVNTWDPPDTGFLAYLSGECMGVPIDNGLNCDDDNVYGGTATVTGVGYSYPDDFYIVGDIIYWDTSIWVSIKTHISEWVTHPGWGTYWEDYWVEVPRGS